MTRADMMKTYCDFNASIGAVYFQNDHSNSNLSKVSINLTQDLIKEVYKSFQVTIIHVNCDRNPAIKFLISHVTTNNQGLSVVVSHYHTEMLINAPSLYCLNLL